MTKVNQKITGCKKKKKKKKMLSERAVYQFFKNLKCEHLRQKFRENATILEAIQPYGPNHLRPKENSLALPTPMDWDLCIVCQKVSSEKLR